MTDRIVFLDQSADALACGPIAGVRLVRLDPSRDALGQIANAVRGLRDLAAIDVVAHGAPGVVSFSSGAFALEDVDARSGDLARIGRALSLDGDLRLWSCETGAGPRGEAFAAALSEAAGANVMMARGLVGPERFGGQWLLDAGTCGAGRPAAPPFSPETLGAFPGVLVASKLYYTVAGVSGNQTQLISVNLDGTGRQVVVANMPASFVDSEVVIDAAANRYFAVVYGGGDGGTNIARIVSGSLTGDTTPTVVKDFNTDSTDVELPLSLEIDPVSHKLFVGYSQFDPDQFDPFLGTTGLDPAEQGIRVLTYATDGTITSDIYGIRQTTAMLPSDAPPNSTFSGGNPEPYFSATDLARFGSTVYFVNAAAADGNEQNSLWRWDGSSGTAIRMTTVGEFPINATLNSMTFQQDFALPKGALDDVVVDGANNFVIFSTHDYLDSSAPTYNYATSALWVQAADATGATMATKLVGASFLAANPNFLPTEMTYDAANRLLYVVSEEGPGGAADDDKIYVFQIGGTSAATATATLVRTISEPNLIQNGNIVGLAVSGNVIPTLDLDASGGGTGYATTFTEGGPTVSIADSDIAISDDDANLTSATVTLSDFRAGDVLALSGGLAGGLTFTDNGGGQVTLSGSATLAAYQTALRQIVYSSTSDDPTAGGTDTSRTITVVINDPFGGQTSATTTVNVTAVDDGGVAANDAFTTDEATSIGGASSVFANNGSGADFDVDGGLAVVAVNGVAGSVGNQITLGSGALLTLNSNGTFDYDPNGAFDSLPGAGSGASNLTATDSFTYTLVGGSTATVTITLSGLDGDGDVLNGTGIGDDLFAGIGGDTLNGAAGNDTLEGGAGADAINGGVDIDVVSYVGSAQGVVINLTSGVNTGGDAAGDSLSGVEIVWGSGLGDSLTGDGGQNNFEGGSGDDLLYGRDGNDRLSGGGGSDWLYGGVGVDSLYGAAGVDYARYDDADYGDLAISLANPAQNTGAAAGDRYFGVEGIIGGVGDDRIGGNGFVNYLYGGAGNDTLAGNGGNDVLFGGAGSDAFVFTEAPTGSEIDRIRDFSVADDTIVLQKTAFTTLFQSGVLNAGAFHIGSGAADANDRIIYDSGTGALLYDRDGTGAAAALQFAQLNAGLALTNNDFVVA